ncbi:CRISPR-associated helicase Cas3' [Catalinimonas niigatensis]|uniref:CRISPR-associated helicase Cas3' n=1 Tax=Catalinimonas niigatensis TaxID=1397264 RepID=UPI002665511E|nr:CRISPR-associated helicase Cas3' [Catalinimonas niigatensis]WPP51831.1 CRISPR-associated helicase Cas3' [Catalinimonas niigatensis]
MANFFDRFWAKSDGETKLEDHTNHVIIAGKNLLERLPFSDSEKVYWKEKLYRCAVLHDLGKIHSAFQMRLNGDTGVSIRHEIISLWFCENFLDLPDDELFAIATHHKGVCSIKDTYKRLNEDVLISEMQYHYEHGEEAMNADVVSDWLNLFNLKLDLKKDTVVSSTITNKWLDILDEFFQKKAIKEADRRRDLSLMRALLIASDHIGSARLENNLPAYKKILINDFRPNKDGQPLEFRNFQTLLQNVQTDVILHAPTGSGKTEAALSWVYANQQENARLFYLLPYTASINAMVKRLQQVFDDKDEGGIKRVTALHSKTLDFFYEQLAEEESNNEKINYAKIEKEARSKKSLSSELFFPIKVATLHQVLKTSLKGKGWELALYDYRNALFIVDEFHTYNALLTGMLLATVRLFRKIFHAKFFFMSATIPDFMLSNIIDKVFDGNDNLLIRPNPEFESDKYVLGRKRHILNCMQNLSIQDKIPMILDYLSKGKSVLVIVNNVKTAQKLFADIGFTDKSKIALLHSGFNLKSRIEIEKKITSLHPPQLLIATQAVEVSLDIDYDVAFIENAPIDALNQRLGRVNRAGRKGLAPIYLFEKIIGNTKFFYEEEILKSTWKSLLELNEKELSEDDLVNVCNRVYMNGYNENQQKDFEQGLNNTIIHDFETDWIAGDWNNWIEEVLESNNQKVEILCSNLVREFDSLREEKRYIEANQLLVKVYFYELKGSAHIKDNKRNVIIANDFEYDEQIGYKKKGDILSFEFL